jgi:hypothetical protein
MPWLQVMSHCARQERHEEALDVCKGIVMALYRGRHGGGELLAYAPDFAEGAAAWVLGTCAKEGRRPGSTRAPPSLPPEFVNECAPEWRWLTRPSR